MGVERLECRALLTVSAGDPAVELITTIAADPMPWFSHAQQSSLGSLVLRISLTPGESLAADPTTTVHVLQTTFNASKQTVGVPPASTGGPITGSPESGGTTPPATAPQITGVIFPGQGVPVLPTDTWPKPIDAFDGQTPSPGSEPQEYVVVLESDSDLVLGLLSFVFVVAGDPSFAEGGGSPGGTDSSGAGDSPGLAGLFDALGGEGGETGNDDPAAGLAMLLAFAALAGLGNEATGPTVTLANDTGVSGFDGITRDGRLDVTAEPGAQLQYSRDDGRTWKSSYRPRPGTNRVQVRSVDSAGIASTATPFAFTLDRTAPAPPALALTLDSGRFASDSRTNTAELTIRRREEGATLEYSVNGGGWTQSYSPVEGRNVVRVRQIDVAGNVSQPSRRITFRLDTQVAAVTSDVLSAAGRTTASRRFIGLERGAIVQYSIDGGTSWSRRRPPGVSPGSTLVRQVDLAGNHSAPTPFGS